ncbi:MAG: hypothetical protein LBC12_02500 [Nitrososphaerota archaeon]|nr:hypothetical protein [Nitrososphaerota archaeon]
MATIPLLSPPIIIIIIIAIALLVRIIGSSKQELKFKQYPNGPAYPRYMPQFSSQMELDMRLPYRRFKKLYPNNNITYEEYKKIQAQSAFKRSLSSQQNHRMVR